MFHFTKQEKKASRGGWPPWPSLSSEWGWDEGREVRCWLSPRLQAGPGLVSVPGSASLREPQGQDLLAAVALQRVWLRCLQAWRRLRSPLPGCTAVASRRIAAIHGGVCNGDVVCCLGERGLVFVKAQSWVEIPPCWVQMGLGRTSPPSLGLDTHARASWQASGAADCLRWVCRR